MSSRNAFHLLSRICLLLPAVPLVGCADDTSSMDGGTTTGSDTTGGPATTVPATTMTMTTADSTGDLTASSGDASETTDDETMTPDSTGDSGTTDDSGTTGDSGTTSDSGTTGDSSDSGSTGQTGSTGDTGAVCGNDTLEEGEDCDGDDLGGATCLSIAMGFSGGTLACDNACAFDTSGCTAMAQPGMGELVITEIMQNPSTLADSDGEYFEVYNPTDADLQLSGCTLEGGAELDVAIDGNVTVAADGFAILATDSDLDQGFVADFQWTEGEYGLANASDTVRIVCNGVTVDEVQYDNGATFPDPNGQSMNLDTGSIDFVLNDNGANWCPSMTDYNGDMGTPGAPNEMCPEPVTYTIDFCRLQFPLTVSQLEGTSVDAFGRLFVEGLTDTTGVNDPAPEIVAEVGYGPDASDPATDLTWTWIGAAPNAGYGPASPSYEANNDEYGATFTVPSPPGEYDFAFRFSGDEGATYTYCDGGAEGSTNGYATADAGQMTSLDAGAPPSIYFSEYVEGSSFNKALEIYNAGAAAADLTTCTLNIYFGGSAMPGNAIALAGSTVDADGVLVICDDDASAGILGVCDVAADGPFFNGDDTVELTCGGEVIDVIGQVGFDPGSAWDVGGVSTLNATLRRLCTVTTGDPDGTDAFDPSVEWTAQAQDTFDDLGQYICPP